MRIFKQLMCLAVVASVVGMTGSAALADNLLESRINPFDVVEHFSPSERWIPEHAAPVQPASASFSRYPVDGADLFGELLAARSSGSASSLPHPGDLYTLDRRPVFLGDIGDNATGRPLKDLSYLSIMPAGFAVLRSGLPAGEALRWQQATETSMSYVRPHRKVQVMLETHSEAGSGSVASRGAQTHAQVLDGLDVQVDSRELGSRSSSFGLLTRRPDGEKPHSGRMLAVGLNLGLLPAALGDCGISVAVVVGQSSNPGPFVSLVTNVAVPTNPPGETVPETEYRPPVYNMVANAATGSYGFGGGFGTNASPPVSFTGGGDPRIPVYPDPPDNPVPEPTTLLLLGVGGAVLAARRRMKKA